MFSLKLFVAWVKDEMMDGIESWPYETTGPAFWVWNLRISLLHNRVVEDNILMCSIHICIE
jgi:hypothetical protein